MQSLFSPFSIFPSTSYSFQYHNQLHSFPSPPSLSHKPLTSSTSTRIFTHQQKTTIHAQNPVPIPTMSSNSVPKKKVLVPIGFGSEEMEAVIIIDVLRRAGANVVVASVEKELEVKCSNGIILVADTSISTCASQVFDLVALPGGMPGSVKLRDCEILRNITSRQAEEKRLYGAICAAPAVTLHAWGLLKTKHSTCHPAFMDMLPTFWAVHSNIQVSGKLTTSRGPGTTFQFALSLVDQLFGEALAAKVAVELLFYADDSHPKLKEFNKVEWSVDYIPTVLVPIASGCEGIEVVTIVDILRRANMNVVVASVEKSMQVVTSQNLKIVAEKSIAKAAELVYDMIILPGGDAGVEWLLKSKVLKKLLQMQELKGRLYGATGASFEILQKYDLLQERRATAHPSTVSKLSSQFDNANTGVIIDGKLITSKGPAMVTDFTLAIVRKLFGRARARSVAEGLVFDYPRS